MMIQKNLEDLEKMCFDYIPCKVGFLAINIIAIYIMVKKCQGNFY